MRSNEIPFEGTVQETMFGPLWARATYSKLYPNLLNDTKAIEIIQEIDYNFSKIEEFLKEWRGLGLLIRARNFDIIIKKFIEKNPNATIINIGAGLDTTFYRVDNNNIQWYDLDLPDAIEFRKRYLPETSRNIYIQKSAFDYTWFDEIKFNPQKGICIIAGGFIYYYEKVEIIAFFRELAERFPEGEIIFDCISNLAKKIGARREKKAGIEGPIWHFGIGNPEKELSKWFDKVKLIDWFTMWAQIPLNPRWKSSTLKMIKIAERFKTAKNCSCKIHKIIDLFF
jgi:O-methyltransferase involved in polyketide biosynthesis